MQAINDALVSAAVSGDRAALQAALDSACKAQRGKRKKRAPSPADVIIRARHSSSKGLTLVLTTCLYTDGGSDENGWLGCLAFMLSIVGDDSRCAEWLDTPMSDAQTTRPLHAIVTNRAGVKGRLAAAVACLAYGADPYVVDYVSVISAVSPCLSARDVRG